MMPAVLNRPDVRHRPACVSSVTSSLRLSPRPRPKPPTPPKRSWSSIDPLAGASTPRWTPWHRTPRCSSLSTDPTSASAPSFGEDADPLEGADAIAEVTMVSQRLAGVPMENNGVLAVPTDGGLTLWVSHQAPHSIHGAYAPLLGIDPAKLRVVCPWVGGGFGPKAAGLRRVHRRRQGSVAAQPTGEVDRDPLGGHGLAGARP